MRRPGTGPPGRRSGPGGPPEPAEGRHQEARHALHNEANGYRVTEGTASGRGRVITGPGPEPMSVAGWLSLSAERDRQLRLRHGYWREGHRHGYERGWRAGYEAARREQEAAWRPLAARVARGASDPTFAELERRRWAVHGEQRTRETFGRPHPADRPVPGKLPAAYPAKRPGRRAAP
jgi:hypothetical protein